jgi:hypothetical protein
MVPLVYMNGGKLAKLADIEVERYDTADIMSCVINTDAVQPHISLIWKKYRGADRENVAAIKV